MSISKDQLLADKIMEVVESNKKGLTLGQALGALEIVKFVILDNLRAGTSPTAGVKNYEH